MNDAIAGWMNQNPRLVMAMGVPVVLYLGHTFFPNQTMRLLCAGLAACAMAAITILAILAGRWDTLLLPALGVIIWSSIAGIGKQFG